MNAPPTDERVADALRWLSEQGTVRGADALLAGARTEVAEVAPKNGHAGHDDGRRSGFRTPVAVAAAVLLVIVVVVGGRRLALPVERVAADQGPSPTAVAPPAPATTVQPDGCAIASPCALPDPITDFEVRSLPEGWTLFDPTSNLTPAEKLKHQQPIVAPYDMEREYRAPVQDIPTPGGMAAARLTVHLQADEQHRSVPGYPGFEGQRTTLPGGRTVWMTRGGSLTGGGVTTASNILVVDLDDRQVLWVNADGLPVDVALDMVSSIVVR
jgi:hypothetical protein